MTGCGQAKPRQSITDIFIPPIHFTTILPYIASSFKEENDHLSWAIEETAWTAALISSPVLKALNPNRIVPSGKVPIVWWAAGAQ